MNPRESQELSGLVLLRQCAEFRKLAAEFERVIGLPGGADLGYRMLQSVMSAMEIVEWHILQTEAVTLSGLQAKAEIAKWARQGNCDGYRQERVPGSRHRRD